MIAAAKFGIATHNTARGTAMSEVTLEFLGRRIERLFSPL
jgi:hypothetical protein